MSEQLDEMVRNAMISDRADQATIKQLTGHLEDADHIIGEMKKVIRSMAVELTWLVTLALMAGVVLGSWLR